MAVGLVMEDGQLTARVPGHVMAVPKPDTVHDRASTPDQRTEAHRALVRVEHYSRLRATLNTVQVNFTKERLMRSHFYLSSYS
jgi:hypothetical protein